MKPPIYSEKDLKLFSIITGLFTASLIISNIASAGKVIALGPFPLSGGVVLFPITYIFGDILTEVYGFRLSRKVIWTGFVSQILAALTFFVVGILPAADFWNDQQTYDKILGVTPRIVLASMMAYFLGEFSNSVVLSKMKYSARGARGITQAGRFIVSTIVGEGVDSIVFMVVAFGGVFTPSQLWVSISTLYVFKILYEIIICPFSVKIANWIKQVEGIDQIDHPVNTHYNPFNLQ